MKGKITTIKLTTIGSLLLALLPGAACGPSSETASQRPEIETVVLISIDTCRPDHLSCYGYSRNTTPNIDALAREGVRFEKVIAPTPITLPSHASLLTGTIPPFHGVHGNGTSRLHANHVTLAELLKAEQFQTAAAVGAFVLDSQYGLDQGFDLYDDSFQRPSNQEQIFSTRRANDVNFAITNWLAKVPKSKLFLFVHYYDPHQPYEPPEPFATHYADAPYAGEIAYVDHQIGQLMESLKQKGLYEKALIIITSDHGEALGGHQETSHGYFIYHDTTRIPLIIKGPGVPKAVVVERKVALVDVMPTVLDLLKLTSSHPMQGQSLVPYFTHPSTDSSSRYLYSESLVPTIYHCCPLFAIENETWKYIQSTKPELYHLGTDPQEAHNLYSQQRNRAATMRKRLEAVLAENLRHASQDSKINPDLASRKRLETLGYFGSQRKTPSLNLDTGWEDPKDFQRAYTALVMAGALSTRDPNILVTFPGPGGKPIQFLPHQAAKDICLRIIEARPTNLNAYAILGRLASVAGDRETSIRHFETMLKLDPGSASVHHDLAIVLISQGQLAKAQTHFETALELSSSSQQVRQDAHGLLKQWGRIDPAWFESQVGLANVLFRQRDYENTITAYRKVLDMKPLATGLMSLNDTVVLAHLRIGISLKHLGRTQEAISTLEHVLTLKPDHRIAKALLQKLGRTVP